MIHRHAKTILPIVAGGLAGTVATVILSRAPSGQSHAEVPRPSAPPTVVYFPSFVDPPTPFAESTSPSAESSQSSTPPVNRRNGEDGLSEERRTEDRRTTIARHEKAIQDHAREPVDVEWARRTEAVFKED